MNMKTIDLCALGAEGAALLCTSDSSYRVFQRAGLKLYQGLAPVSDLYQVRLYTYNADEQLLHEEAVVAWDGELQGSDSLPLYQLPDRLIKSGEIVTRNHGSHQETLVPLSSENGIVGLLVLTSTEAFTQDFLDGLGSLAGILSLGVQYVLRSRQAERATMLLRAATRMGRELQGISGAERLLYHFVTLAVEQLGFDRASLFIFEEDGITVKRGLCVCTGHGVKELKTIPTLPPLEGEPKRLPHVPGLWLPMRIGNRLLGALLVDNLYSLEVASEDATQTLVDLSGQVALALENARLFDRLHELALKDDLTGLYRPRYFYERVQEELSKTKRRPVMTGLLMIDLDYYKQVNDRYGHPAGDAVLIQAADLIRKSLRAGDIACRMGGDEFMVLVPNILSDQAEQLAIRILNLFAENDFVLPDDRTIRISTSIGVATFPEDANDWQQLLYRADQALYYAKQHGRGRVSVHSKIKDAIEGAKDETDAEK